MKAITIWQPWASLIIAGAKPYEFRRWAAPSWVVGERIAIHAGARQIKRDEIADLIGRLRQGEPGTGLKPELALPILDKVLLSPGRLPLASVVGTAVIGKPRLASQLFAGVADSDRIDQHVWAWPMLDIQPMEPPIPARGAQGWWNWTPPIAPVAEAREARG